MVEETVIKFETFRIEADRSFRSHTDLIANEGGIRIVDSIGV